MPVLSDKSLIIRFNISILKKRRIDYDFKLEKKALEKLYFHIYSLGKQKSGKGNALFSISGDMT